MRRMGRRGLRSLNNDNASFSPANISGLVVWYDFSDITTLFQDTARTTAITADAQVIKGVADKSGSGNHLSEATNGPAYKVNIQNGLSVAQFDGVDDQLSAGSLTSDDTKTEFIVMRKRSAPGVAGAGAWSSQLHQIFARSDFSATDWHYYNAVSGSSLLGSATTTHAIVLNEASAASQSNYTDGGTARVIDPDDGGATNIFLLLGNGSLGPADVDSMEVVIFDSSLSAANMNLVGEYLADKWGLTWTTIS